MQISRRAVFMIYDISFCAFNLCLELWTHSIVNIL
uniref:Dihydrolipoyl dehydrogenase 2ic-like n=1 Tax=Rhizophora mucronata TaxID=61149 RepID=A0A2P2L8B7_RHIMU